MKALLAAAALVVACAPAENVFPEHYVLQPSMPEALKLEVRSAFDDWCERTDGLACATELEYPGTEAHSVPVLVEAVPQSKIEAMGFDAFAVTTPARGLILVGSVVIELGRLDYMRHNLRHEIGHFCVNDSETGHLVDNSNGEVLMTGGNAWTPVLPSEAAPLGIDELSLSAFVAGCNWE